MSGKPAARVRLVGWSADQWLKRLDEDDGDLPGWHDKLLNSEPYMDATNTLPERL